MIGRFLIKNHRNLLKLKNADLLNVLPKRSVLKIIEKLDHYPDQGPLIYRFRDMKQDTNDFWWTAAMVAALVFGSSSTIYMNWDEMKIADPPGYHQDLSRFSDEELGVPKDDELGYAPLRADLVKDGKLLDIGNTFRTENRYIYHVYAVRNSMPNPYDM